MKFTETIIAAILVAACSVSAAPVVVRRGTTGTPAPRCPSGFSVAVETGGKVACVPSIPAPSRTRKVRRTFGVARRQTSPSPATSHSPKDRAIKQAQHHNATDAEVAFLNSIPDATFQAMENNQRKVSQATEQLWHSQVPDLAALPTAVTRPPGGGRHRNGTHTHTGTRTHSPRPTGTPGQKPSEKNFFLRFAKHQPGVTADTLTKLQAEPDATFDNLRNVTSTKDLMVQEATLLGLTNMTDFFSNTVPAAIFTQLDQVKATLKQNHEDIKAQKIPTP